ncbi:hypothetical protein DNTS_033775 [Danionella cerebrum]|uniref:Ermin n=1 Tax=Danionella cerebrum TaxID=2873325 RepID=A0A553R319_9TELE|nr:hypothetical protein DNTS_033775 [Danionella translucida]
MKDEETSMERQMVKADAEKEQANNQTVKASEETTKQRETLYNESEDFVENDADSNEENSKEEDEEEDELPEFSEDAFQSSVEMSVLEYEKDGNNRPVCRYNTVCYRKIKRGNTRQRIDEFESILNF